MPSASPELQAQWPGDDDEAIKYLLGRQWELRQDWHWRKPSPDHQITERENSAISYLCDEWDFGGVVP